jgi:Xaa-Pro aminopeptidase
VTWDDPPCCCHYIYIREAALNDLPKTAENIAFADAVRTAVQKYKDIGIRIEDSFLLTDSGLENLSRAVPRTLDDVERFVSSKGTR